MDNNYIAYKGIKVQSLFIIILIVLFCLPGISVIGQTLYFVHNGPVGSVETFQVYFETKIFKYDILNNTLAEIWTLGERQETRKISVYPSEGKILILSSLEQPNRLYIFSINNMKNPVVIDLDTNIAVNDFHYYSVANGNDFVELRTNDISKKRGQGFASSIYAASDGKLLADKDLIDYSGQIRLCGGATIGSPSPDVISINSLESGKVRAWGTQLGFEFNSVDTGVIQQGSSKGWVLFANEPDYCALESVPDKNGLSTRELLIHNNNTSMWKSIIVPGEESEFKTLGNWLMGRIIHGGPQTDYERGVSYGSRMDREIILLNPIENRQFTVNLGPAVEVLWIEGDVIYYKSADNLYKARIVGDEIVDRVKLLNDPPIRYFVYGLMDKPIKNKESKLTE